MLRPGELWFLPLEKEQFVLRSLGVTDSRAQLRHALDALADFRDHDATALLMQMTKASGGFLWTPSLAGRTGTDASFRDLSFTDGVTEVFGPPALSDTYFLHAFVDSWPAWGR